MQIINGPEETKFAAVEAAIHPQRLNRYLPAANLDRKTAFSYYMWNSLLCENFHLSLHFAEIVCRNALHNGLTRRCGDEWYKERLLTTQLLDDRYRTDLKMAVESERKQHGSSMTPNHIVSALTFGFWEHLTTKRFERFLWAKGIANIFPNAPNTMTLDDLHTKIESVRRWRNRIAHHRAIFDKSPMRKHQDTLDLIHLACADTSKWVATVSRVPQALSLRP
jgi:hypothetical protein